MKSCPHCHLANPVDGNFCQHCGKPLVAPTSADATVMMSATQVGKRLPREQTFDVPVLSGGKSRLVIGRAPDCDIYLPHPNVSRYHARIERRAEGLFLVDLSSVNGVWLSGRRINEPALLQEGDLIGVGPFLLSLKHGVLRSLDNSKSLRLEARGLVKEVRLADGGRRKLLDGIDLVVYPGEFVSLLGPSGSGKSTLMDCLNGRRRATEGKVLANGEDFYRHFDSFRQSLGYVPQRDIVHTLLTVHRALFYTAKLRLPPDTDPEELTDRIESVLKEMELVPHRDTLVANLSGGQIKRVSLGAELLGQPALLYIDEATSGLDAGTEARMMRLFRRLADEGRSIICITHNVEHVEQCHLALVLMKGHLVYYGPPSEAPRYFQVKRIGDIYDRLSQRDVSEWERDFAASSLHREFVLDRLAASTPSSSSTPEPVEPETPARGLSAILAEGRKKVEEHFPPLADYFRQLETRNLRWREVFGPIVETWHQMGVLTARYVELIRGDRRGLRLLLWQAPIVALFLLMGFLAQPFRQPMPLLRPLTSEERQALRVLRGLGELLDGDRTLTDQQREALRKIKLQLSGYPVAVDGTTVVRYLRRLLRTNLTEAEQAVLEQGRLVMDLDGESVTVSGADLVHATRQVQEARFAERLLQVQGSVVPRDEGINPRFTYILLFILAMIVLWFGCNNAAKEIVKEEAIYGRERAVNLRIVPYLASKFIVMSVVTVVHVAALMVLLYGTLELLARYVPGYSTPAPEQMLGYGQQFGVLVLLAMSGVALGLLLSSCVSSPDRANALLPYVLIPQMILGGGILAVEHGALRYLAMGLSPVYWAYRAIHLGAHDLPPDYPGYVHYPDGLGLPCLALGVQTMALLSLTWGFMKRKDV